MYLRKRGHLKKSGKWETSIREKRVSLLDIYFLKIDIFIRMLDNEVCSVSRIIAMVPSLRCVTLSTVGMIECSLFSTRANETDLYESKYIFVCFKAIVNLNLSIALNVLYVRRDYSVGK